MKICLDAGHSGKTNPYTINGKSIGWESEMAWTLHEKLRDKLLAAGAEVICTRETICEDPALEVRGRMAKDCDLFLSLHSNAGSKTADYPLACCSVDGSADKIGMELACAVDEVMQTAQTARIWKRDYQTGTGTMHLSAGDADFGKRTALKDYYGVLRGAAQVGVPGVLLECSFHSNPEMAQWLIDDSNLDRLASALCAVLVPVRDWEARYNALVAELNALLLRYQKGNENYVR